MVLEQVVEEYAGNLEVVIVDIQAYQQAANEYLVRGLPRYSLFHKGKHKYSVAGTKTFREFKDWLDEVMHEDN
jgi:thioredoxin-like negative regulator of GroEL